MILRGWSKLKEGFGLNTDRLNEGILPIGIGCCVIIIDGRPAVSESSEDPRCARDCRHGELHLAVVTMNPTAYQ